MAGTLTASEQGLPPLSSSLQNIHRTGRKADENRATLKTRGLWLFKHCIDFPLRERWLSSPSLAQLEVSSSVLGHFSGLTLRRQV